MILSRKYCNMKGGGEGIMVREVSEHSTVKHVKLPRLGISCDRFVIN